MKMIEWLKKLFQGKQTPPVKTSRAEGFRVIDAQYHIHTNEKI